MMQATEKDFARYAADNGMTAQREAKSHAALWHNIQVPHFARLAEMVWGGQVSVLPNMAVYAAAQQAARSSKSKVVLSLHADNDGISTTYSVGGKLLTIDAATGETI